MLASKILFPAPPSTYTSEMAGLVELPNANTYGLFVSPRTTAKRAILYLHGNCCDLGQLRMELKMYAEHLGVAVFAVEYTGYGVNQTMPNSPPPSATAIDDCALAGLNWLSQKFHSSDIFIFGCSIGTGPACKLTASLSHEKRVGGLILQSPYTSIQDLVTGIVGKTLTRFGTWALGGNVWDNVHEVSKVARSGRPLLVIHGKRDEVVPFSHGVNLFNSYCQQVGAESQMVETYQSPHSAQSVQSPHSAQSVKSPPPPPLLLHTDAFGHNSYDVMSDVIQPLSLLLCKVSEWRGEWSQE
eukprot:GHVN01021506.1.p1 GENE.GHVN01021506.1~~GHVN01021506.1.p1  ORF type:complete len:299 (+),score=54.54 GHVN01021506.1:16-912(+)